MIYGAAAFAVAIGLAVIESVFMPSIEVAGIRPDLAVLVVLVATCRTNFGRTMALAFVFGLTRDFFSTGLIGMSSFSLVLTAYLLIGAEEYFLTENWKTQVFVVFLGSIIFGSLFACLKMIAGYETASAFRVFEIILGTAVYTGLAAPLAFALTNRPEPASYMRLRKRYNVEHETLYQTEV